MNETGILIIGGDKATENLIATALGMHDYHCMQADKGEQGILSVVSRWLDIILLDLGLPDTNRVDVIREIRSRSKIPIIVISARNEDDGKIAALSADADGHLAKSSSVDELLARLHTTQRWPSCMQGLKEDQSPILINGGLTVDYTTDYATLDSEKFHLTSYEYKFLCLLAHSVGKALTHSYITRET